MVSILPQLARELRPSDNRRVWELARRSHLSPQAGDRDNGSLSLHNLWADCRFLALEEIT
jgi:hypothetical protein